MKHVNVKKASRIYWCLICKDILIRTRDKLSQRMIPTKSSYSCSIRSFLKGSLSQAILDFMMREIIQKKHREEDLSNFNQLYFKEMNIYMAVGSGGA